MTHPLVSIITGTWQRHELLLETIENVRSQSHRPLEHIVVSDGPDVDLQILVNRSRNADWESDPARCVPITFVALGRNWSSVLPSSFGAAPLVVGQLLARGEYQVFCADDERMEPDHIESLVQLLEATGADFGYSQVKMWWKDRPEHTWVIGTDPPQCGQITNVLYRRDLLKLGLYPVGAGMTSDWTNIHNWMQRGATHAFLPRVTFTHRSDH